MAHLATFHELKRPYESERMDVVVEKDDEDVESTNETKRDYKKMMRKNSYSCGTREEVSKPLIATNTLLSQRGFNISNKVSTEPTVVDQDAHSKQDSNLIVQRVIEFQPIIGGIWQCKNIFK